MNRPSAPSSSPSAVRHKSLTPPNLPLARGGADSPPCQGGVGGVEKSPPSCPGLLSERSIDCMAQLAQFVPSYGRHLAHFERKYGYTGALVSYYETICI